MRKFAQLGYLLSTVLVGILAYGYTNSIIAGIFIAVVYDLIGSAFLMYRLKKGSSYVKWLIGKKEGDL